MNKHTNKHAFHKKAMASIVSTVLLSLVLCKQSHSATIPLNVSPAMTWSSEGTHGYLSKEAAFAGAVQYYTDHINDYLLWEPYMAAMPVSGLYLYASNETVNGVNTLYGWDVVLYPGVDLTGTPVGPNKTGVVAAEFDCPAGAGFNWTTNATVQNPIATIATLSCGQLNLITQDSQPGECPVGNPIFPESGMKIQREVDYQSPSGLLDFIRTYRSDVGTFTSVATQNVGFIDNQSTSPSTFCVAGTFSSYSSSANQIVPGNTISCFPIIRDGTATALLAAPSGRITKFTTTGTTATSGVGSNDSAIRGLDGTGAPIWIVTREENNQEVYAASGQLLSRWTMDGKKVEFSYSDTTTQPTQAPSPGYLLSETDSFGRQLSFTYNEFGFLVGMTDPAGQAYSYAYDTQNRLANVNYPNGLGISYIWNEAANTSGTDIFGALTGRSETWNGITTRVGTYGYDSTGNVISTAGAGGVNKYAVIDRQSTQITMTDPLGTVRAVQFTPINGTPYLTASSQPAGSGCSASQKSNSYDANGNATATDDFSGNRTCHAFDPNRNLETVRVEGLNTDDVCSAVIESGASIPVSSRKTTSLWHPDWRVEISRAEPKKRTDWVYNGQPDPFNGNAPANCAPSAATMPDGKAIAVLCKIVEQATTDERGEAGLAAIVAGPPRVSSFTYNLTGQMLTYTDARGYTTTYSYYGTSTDNYAVGDLQSITNAAGHVNQYLSYDKNGRVLQAIDPNGVISNTSYTPRGWISTITMIPGTGQQGETISFSYDGIGNISQVTLPNGSSLNYSYDAAHRLTGIEDAAGNMVAYSLDSAGNRISEQVQDSSGVLARNITRVFDALNRLQNVTGAPQ